MQLRYFVVPTNFSNFDFEKKNFSKIFRKPLNLSPPTVEVRELCFLFESAYSLLQTPVPCFLFYRSFPQCPKIKISFILEDFGQKSDIKNLNRNLK